MLVMQKTLDFRSKCSFEKMFSLFFYWKYTEWSKIEHPLRAHLTSPTPTSETFSVQVQHVIDILHVSPAQQAVAHKVMTLLVVSIP